MEVDEAALVGAAHDAQQAGDRAPTWGQNGADEQDPSVAPGAVDEERRKGQDEPGEAGGQAGTRRCLLVETAPAYPSRPLRHPSQTAPDTSPKMAKFELRQHVCAGAEMLLPHFLCQENHIEWWPLPPCFIFIFPDFVLRILFLRGLAVVVAARSDPRGGITMVGSSAFEDPIRRPMPPAGPAACEPESLYGDPPCASTGAENRANPVAISKSFRIFNSYFDIAETQITLRETHKATGRRLFPHRST
nr:hypothetical protein [Methylobacterium aquaticum]